MTHPDLLVDFLLGFIAGMSLVIRWRLGDILEELKKWREHGPS